VGHRIDSAITIDQEMQTRLFSYPEKWTMRHLTTNPIVSACVMFGAICAALMFWICYRPEIQSIIRAVQNVIFGWQS
jgi:hypothetical protein